MQFSSGIDPVLQRMRQSRHPDLAKAARFYSLELAGTAEYFLRVVPEAVVDLLDVVSLARSTEPRSDELSELVRTAASYSRSVAELPPIAVKKPLTFKYAVSL